MFGSVTTYTCEPGLELVGQDTLSCTTENGTHGAWSGAPPECRGERSSLSSQPSRSPAVFLAQAGMVVHFSFKRNRQKCN